SPAAISLSLTGHNCMSFGIPWSYFIRSAFWCCCHSVGIWFQVVGGPCCSHDLKNWANCALTKLSEGSSWLPFLNAGRTNKSTLSPVVLGVVWVPWKCMLDVVDPCRQSGIVSPPGPPYWFLPAATY